MRETRITWLHIAGGGLASDVKTFELPDVVQHTGVAQYHRLRAICCHMEGAVILSHERAYPSMRLSEDRHDANQNGNLKHLSDTLS